MLGTRRSFRKRARVGWSRHALGAVRGVSRAGEHGEQGEGGDAHGRCTVARGNITDRQYGGERIVNWITKAG